jgi:two-component system, sensor histidine kinase and response regulator
VRQNLVTVLDASDDAITTCSLDGVFVTWNRGAEKLYGYRGEEAIGQPLDLIVPLSERDHEHDRWQQLLADEAVKSLETKRTTKDGRTVVVAVTRSLIFDPDGGVVGVASVGRDITELKRAQILLEAAHAEAVEASKMKSQFMANMNHELRTPLNGVIGISRLLLETELTLEQREYAEALQVSGEALLGVIGDILDFSKVEAGKLELVDETFELNSLVHGVCAIVGLGTPATDAVTLTAAIESGLPARLWGDATRLRQVLTNLVGNAVKFTPRGTVTINVRGQRATNGEPQLHFDVADTGIGIAPEVQETIFESFAQADGSTTRRYGGTGLGLAIARELVTLMGGSIGVRSVLGEGSSFWFTVPLRAAED